MTITSETLFATIAAVGVAAAGAGCSGGSDASAEAERARASQSEATAAGAPGARDGGGELATAEFRVAGMTCGGCAIATEMAVKKLDGVESADAEYRGDEESGRCTVTYDPSVVSTDRLGAAIEGAGFEPTLARTSSGP